MIMISNTSGFFSADAIWQSLKFSGSNVSLSEIEKIYDVLKPEEKHSLKVMKIIKERLNYVDFSHSPTNLSISK